MKKPPGMTRGLALSICSCCESEAEGKELGAAGGIAVCEGAKANLMGDARACERLCEDSDHDAKHGGPSIEEFGSLELLDKDQLFLAVLKKRAVGGWVGHGVESQLRRVVRGACAKKRSGQPDLGQNSLACQQFCTKANDEAQHGQAAIPGFSEANETKARGGSSHGCFDL